ncbi:MAG: FapA family protein, partial [Lachnospiraceae bacterium]|nr:FapA family protein [Lachnospiraceae bacterium]
MNGYFRLIAGNGGTIIELFAPKDGGKPLDPVEVTEYLKTRNIWFDSKELIKAVGAAATEDKKIAINKNTIVPEREACVYNISPDEMTVTARFYAGCAGTEDMTEEEVLSDLKNRGVVFGIDRQAVHDFFAGERKYCTDVVFANGTPIREGKDGYVEYLFDTDMRAKPKLNEDGSVDFFHLDMLRECKEGDELAILHAADPGESGQTVTGHFVKPRDVKKAHFDFGKNVQMSEDGKKLICAQNGHIEFIQGRISVSDVLQVSNVDPSTGDVEYDGN